MKRRANHVRRNRTARSGRWKLCNCAFWLNEIFYREFEINNASHDNFLWHEKKLTNGWSGKARKTRSQVFTTRHAATRCQETAKKQEHTLSLLPSRPGVYVQRKELEKYLLKKRQRRRRIKKHHNTHNTNNVIKSQTKPKSHQPLSRLPYIKTWRGRVYYLLAAGLLFTSRPTTILWFYISVWSLLPLSVTWVVHAIAVATVSECRG